MELDLFGITYSKTEQFTQKELSSKHHTQGFIFYEGDLTPAVASFSLPQERKLQQELLNFKLHTREVIRTFFKLIFIGSNFRFGYDLLYLNKSIELENFSKLWNHIISWVGGVP